MKLLNRKQKLNLDKSKTYLLACSGGPDSMALFEMLNQEGYKFDVAHVNYKSRQESDSEEKLVRNYAEKCGIFAHILEKKCSSAENFEKEARNIRYNFFKIIMKETGKYDALLVAHNADDSIETYVLQVKRKIIPDTYGLTKETYFGEIKIIRPLLRYEKKFLTKYCDKNKIPYSIDQSNFDVKYQRNLVRKTVILNMNHENKNEFLKEIHSKNKLVSKLKIKFEDNIEGASATIFSKNIEVLQRFLFYFVKKQGNFMLSASYKNLLNDIVNDNFNKLYKFDRFYIVFDTEGLTFYRRNPEQISYEYTKKEFEKIGTCYVEGDIVIKPLKEFEYILVNGHKKKVNRFFIDCKMPLSLRYIWPAVSIDKISVFYTPRYRKKYKISEASKLVFSPKTLQNLNIF